MGIQLTMIEDVKPWHVLRRENFETVWTMGEVVYLTHQRRYTAVFVVLSGHEINFFGKEPSGS